MAKIKLNVDLIYPVGSIYLTVSNENPSDLFGGTWEQIEDRFLLACGSTYSNGSTGGEANHKLTIDEIPKHRHQQNNDLIYKSGNWWIGGSGGTTISVETAYTNYVGGDQAHNNMPPYLAVYMWKRIS